ncbi:hypothetical protein DSO57_1011780 [Entomophthora muscae]|uniref:Uncharacterized protein n=1 Tax=Entomophthora muscae TaxID=34485 RepID=A0ACC2TH38_9FUNG|nr:hypothetical protein DSO57_1011780 [Entomophthora muscae]
MKPSVVALICPEANASMPALIAEAKRAEKNTNREYAACSSNCSSNGNSRDNSNGHKRQNTNCGGESPTKSTCS